MSSIILWDMIINAGETSKDKVGNNPFAINLKDRKYIEAITSKEKGK
jgi:hypothetical protein